MPLKRRASFDPQADLFGADAPARSGPDIVVEPDAPSGDDSASQGPLEPQGPSDPSLDIRADCAQAAVAPTAPGSSDEARCEDEADAADDGGLKHVAARPDRPAKAPPARAASAAAQPQRPRMPPGAGLPPLLSVRDVAARYGVGVSTVWRWTKTDPAFPVPIQITNGTTRWRRAELDAFEASRERSVPKSVRADAEVPPAPARAAGPPPGGALSLARRYSHIRPKRDVVYDAEAVRQLYGICENTLTNWRKAGLRATDDRLPTLFTGAELGRFHKARARARRRSLRPSEFLCLGCKAVVIPDPAAVVLRTLARGGARAEGPCPACGAGLSKLLNETDRHALERGLDLNASPGIRDEDDSASQAGVVTEAGSAEVSWIPMNERVLHDFLAYCGRYNPRTVEAIMASIRDFERSLGPKPFDRLTHRDVDAWRAALLKRGAADAPDAKSRSTIRHRASHVKAFLKWLVQQEGYRRLKAGLAEYAVLPKAASAQLLQPPPRPYPSIEEALALIDAMPAGTPRERRDRAIVAFVFLTGLRADTTASIRFGDVDPTARTVRVDARAVRAKNGKSLEIFWFPVGEAFEAVVRGWIDELASRGARAEDAFFPKDEALAGDGPLVRADDAPLERWASSDAIRRAFAIACGAAGGSAYTPHAARHSLKALGDRICRTEADRDGWSRNLGHESRQITVSHYAKLTDGQRKAVFDRLRSGETETDEEKDLLLAYFEHRLIPGTPEFERAESLADERRRRRRPSG